MINEAIQSTINPILDAYIHQADDGADVPFSVHESIGEPVRTKEGIQGYTYRTDIVIVCADPADRETKTIAVIAALEALDGTTVNGTDIEAVEFINEDPGYDQENELYGNTLTFTIQTKNR